MPFVGYETFDTHWEHIWARRHNIFKPVLGAFAYTNFAKDRMRLSQVNSKSLPGIPTTRQLRRKNRLMGNRI